MTKPTNARTLSADERAAQKAAYLGDARDILRGKMPASDAFFARTYTPEQRRALIDADIAAIGAGGAKFGAPATEARGNTSSTAYAPAPIKYERPTNAREMTAKQYAARKADYLKNGY
ncbi:UNVERIFIED_ORG: hypothetical protein ABIC54_001623 [Burkholderia sp. 1263]